MARIIRTDKYNIYIEENSLSEANRFISKKNYSSVFILADQNTKKHCLPKIKKHIPKIHKAEIISIKSGERNKNIHTCVHIWKELSRKNAGRKSLLINLGGGVISDIGGFAASTYKRGIDFINIPTTLLAQVDASVGGKTGIDFNDYKNQVGTFAFPKAVFIQINLLVTLQQRQIRSGMAEVIKHALIADEKYWKDFSPHSPFSFSGGNGNKQRDLITRSIEIKNHIVSADPYENGQRKLLNFGHTIGHAVETASLQTNKPLLHGEAIAIGMICETYLSNKYCKLPNKELRDITQLLLDFYHPIPIAYSIEKLISLMKQDKKNRDSEINFTLLRSIGKAEINHSCTKKQIREALRYFNTSAITFNALHKRKKLVD